MSVVIETTMGDITVDLFTEERPVACLNFLKLCRLKYYNYNLFHTIEQGFIAQTGDPVGKGDGGSSVWGLVEGNNKRFFEAESLPKIYHSSAGLVSLVSAGKNLVGSQFFFTLGANLTSLDGIHCVIGEVVEGHETLRKLNEAIVDESFRPYQDIRITHTVVLDDPFPDPRGFQVPKRSPSPTADRLQNGRIAADEDIDDTDGKTMEEIQEMLAEREAKARATILEIVGDIPDADVAPPENVLFVCKLNPVTTDDDLEIIFSRFGKVKGCEVIRDKKTGDSLQYAFVEFEEQKACEAAYFKMDNVLIDDRRIHVDFSQSVAKVKWRGKGRGVEGSQGRLDFNNLREDKTSVRNHNSSRNDYVDRRERMTSDERRREREKRHREQERRRNSRSKSRSPSRYKSRNSKKYHERERPYERSKYRDHMYSDRNRRQDNYQKEKRNDRTRHERDVSSERTRRDSVEQRSQTREKPCEKGRYSKDRYRDDGENYKQRQSAERAAKKTKPKKRKYKSSDDSDDTSENSTSDAHTLSHSDSGNSNSSKEYKKKKKSTKSKRKKSKKQKKKHKSR